MSSDQFLTLFFGTLLIVFVIGGFFLLVRYVRNQFFPQEKSDKLERAMMEMQVLQAQLEAEAEEGEEGGEEAGEDEPVEEATTSEGEGVQANDAEGEQDEEDPTRRLE